MIIIGSDGSDSRNSNSNEIDLINPVDGDGDWTLMHYLCSLISLDGLLLSLPSQPIDHHHRPFPSSHVGELGISHHLIMAIDLGCDFKQRQTNMSNFLIHHIINVYFDPVQLARKGANPYLDDAGGITPIDMLDMTIDDDHATEACKDHGCV